MKIPKPEKGAAKKAREQRKRELDDYRILINRQVLERDGYICQHCGAPATHGHHCFGRGNSPEHEFESCEKRLSLCSDCHYAVHHGGQIKITREDLIADLERAMVRREKFLSANIKRQVDAND